MLYSTPAISKQTRLTRSLPIFTATPTMRFTDRASFLLPALIALPSFTTAFYLPGVAPTSYDEGQAVPLYVNHLTPSLSRDDQLHSVFSYDYYHPAFGFCQPADGPKDVRESLGSILFGDRIRTSPFELKMAQMSRRKPSSLRTYLTKT